MTARTLLAESDPELRRAELHLGAAVLAGKYTAKGGPLVPVKDI